MTSTHRAMTLRLPEDQCELLEMVAAVDGVSMTEAIRTAIAEHIESRRADSSFQRRLSEHSAHVRHHLAALKAG